jgi:hypothetical protein
VVDSCGVVIVRWFESPSPLEEAGGGDQEKEMTVK